MTSKNGVTESTTELHEEDREIGITNEQKFKDLSFKQKCSYIKRSITVEPYFCAILIPPIFSGVPSYYLQVKSACYVNLGLNDTICTDENASQYAIQETRNNVYGWMYPLVATLGVLVVLFISSYSDRQKIRKPFFIVPVIGEIFSGLGLIACVIFVKEWPIEAVVFMASILPTFFGGTQTQSMVVYSYISDTSSKEARTVKIGTMQVIGMIVAPIFVLLSGVIHDFITILVICVAFLVFALLYAIFFLKETQTPITSDKNICVEFFDLRNILRDIWNTAVKKREGHKRLLLVMLFIVNILIKGPSGEESIRVKQYVSNRFSWREENLSYVVAFDMVVDTVGAYLLVAIFVKRFKMPDLLIAVMACTTKLIGGIWYAFSDTVLLFYLGSFVSMFATAFQLSLRSFATKIVDLDEIAKSQALFSLCDALAPICYSQIYKKFFNATQKTFASAFYLLGSVLMIPAIFVLLAMYVIQKKDLEKTETVAFENTQEVYKNNLEMDEVSQ